MKQSGSTPKKQYRPPRLVRYGDLQRLTGAKGGSNADGQGKPRTRAGGPRT